MRRLLVGVIALAAVAGCDPDQTLTDAPALQASAAASQKTMVQGAGIFELAGVGPVSFNYHVKQVPGEAATGTFSLFFEADGYVIDFDAEATCLSVDAANNRGWVGGVVTANRSTHPSFINPLLHDVGRDVWFRTVDYGEGSNAPADRSTTFGFRGAAGILTSADYCLVRPWPAADARTWPVTQGNIQVKE